MNYRSVPKQIEHWAKIGKQAKENFYRDLKKKV
jgi:hypothetical protein